MTGMNEKSDRTAEELQAEVDELTKALEDAKAALAEKTTAPGEEARSAFETAEEIGERMQEGLADLQQRIDRNPVPSALIALAIGFLLGRIFSR